MKEPPRKKKTAARAVTRSDRGPDMKVGGSMGGSMIIGENNVVTTGFTRMEAAAFMNQLAKGFKPIPFNGNCPYKGLDAFMETDAELFFGREELVKKLVSRVQNSRTLFITGPSGSGKSSLARAGLIPALKNGKIREQHSREWKYATLKPGDNPLEGLEDVFSVLKTPDLADYFHKHRTEQDVILKCARSVLSPDGDDRLVLFLDQFEEVFTLVNKEKDRVHLFDLLHHAA